MSSLTNKDKADLLREGEKKSQERWNSEGIFETGGPDVCIIQRGTRVVETRQQKKNKSHKFYGTVPLLPMESRLHMAHIFTILQVDFAAGYAMMKGKRVLFSLGFQCSGSSNPDRAERIREELVTIGHSTASEMSSDDVRQNHPETWILYRQGIPGVQIRKFEKYSWWIAAFPALAKYDLQMLGVRVDWRRTFAGGYNPFYRSFVQWQVKRLRDLSKLQYGKAFTLYSLEHNEPCPERNGADGKRLRAVLHTAVKMKVVELSKSLTEKLRNSLPPQVVLNIACSVSRCECLYGLGCCFVSLGVSYGVYTVSQNEYLLVSQNAARNMAHQGILPPWGRLEEVASLNGSDLVGTLIGGSFADEAISIRLLPEIITTSIEGTGIRAGFPMEDVGDYLSFVTLRERLKDHEIQAGWLSQLPPTIIQTPTKSLPTPSEMCQKIDHSGPTDELLDSQELRNMAEMAAGEAYFHGRMLVGAHRGMPINEARELIKRSLLKSGQAFEYRQPSGPPETIGDCVVAYLEHWHLGLSSEGESRGSRWVRETCNFLNSSKFQHISVEGRTELHDAVQRLGSWAIGRGRGYGTQAPWDEALLIDPFTEAAIAPAYQTIAHFLHADMYGEILGLGVVRPEQMTDQVWDFVFSRLDIRSAELEKVTTDISHSTLCRMRLEFEWWYPTNLYVADKGQIQDHLVFFLCHHVALFVPKYWPRGARVSGEMLLEGKKMSGRQGHMVPAGRMIDKYGADAVRMAIARASTNLSMDDVEWDENIALDSMRRLYELKDYLEKLSKASCERSGAYQSSRGEAVNDGGRDGDLGVWDSSLMDEIQWIARKAGSCYESNQFCEAVHYAFDEMGAAFDSYLQMTRDANIGLHRSAFKAYVQTQTLVLAPVCPHWCEDVRSKVLKEATTTLTTPFPEVASPYSTFAASTKLLRDTVSGVREDARENGKDSGSAGVDCSHPFVVTLFFATEYLTWQLECIKLMEEGLGGDEMRVDLELLNMAMKAEGVDVDKARRFAKHLQDLLERGMDRKAVLNKRYPGDQAVVLQAVAETLKQTLPGCMGVRVVEMRDGQSVAGASRPTPGFPTWVFQNSGPA